MSRSRRLSTDAKIVLTNAGYNVARIKLKRGKEVLRVWEGTGIEAVQVGELPIVGGVVDNPSVERLLGLKS